MTIFKKNSTIFVYVLLRIFLGTFTTAIIFSKGEKPMQATSLRVTNNHRQQHRAFQVRTEHRLPLPHQSINPRQYWKTLARKLKTMLPSDNGGEQAWNKWVAENAHHTDLNRLLIAEHSEESTEFRLRAAVILLVPAVSDFHLFARPACQEYRNLLHIARLWFAYAKHLPDKEQVFVCKLILLSAHTTLAKGKDLLTYAWCAAEAISWQLPIVVKRKLVEFLESMLPLAEDADSHLFDRLKTAILKAKAQ